MHADYSKYCDCRECRSYDNQEWLDVAHCVGVGGMIVYHVCSYSKLNKYIRTGAIMPPVRAWESIEQARRMSISTGRRIILRLRFPKGAEKLAGHFNQARVLNQKYPLKGI